MRRYHILYTAFVALIGLADITAANAGNSGLLAPTACLSPLAIIVIAALPMETIAAKSMQKLGFNPDRD